MLLYVKIKPKGIWDMTPQDGGFEGTLPSNMVKLDKYLGGGKPSLEVFH